MAKLFDHARDFYNLLFEELPDPKTKNWLLLANPYELPLVLFLYLMFVFKWGPAFMKNRQPFNLEKILILYNAFQVVTCTYLFINSLDAAWGWDYKWICEPVDHSINPKSMRIARLCYMYFSLKVIDLLDTVFFVLRKKFNQVSFLHIYHHTGMCLLIWGAVTYMPGGHGSLVGVINSFVHIIMYSYYLLSVAVPSIKNALWIKKHVTQLQILQFFWCVLHMTIIVFINDCAYPRWTSAIFLPHNVFLLILFIDFYIKTYIKKPREQKLQADMEKLNNEIHENGATETIETDTNKLNDDEIIDGKNFLKNDLSKHVNDSYTNYKNEFIENVNSLENCKEKSTCESGKCKINCHKHKNE